MRPRRPDPRAGLGLIQALLAVLLLAALSLAMVYMLEWALFHEEGAKPSFLNTVKIVYAEKRLQELDASIQLFAQEYGCLPGDCAGAALPEPRGNGNGRVEREEEEHRGVFPHLQHAGKLESQSPLFLGRPLEFFWLEAPRSDNDDSFASANYLVVRGLPAAIVDGVDDRLDDSAPESGRILRFPAASGKGADLFCRIRF